MAPSRSGVTPTVKKAKHLTRTVSAVAGVGRKGASAGMLTVKKLTTKKTAGQAGLAKSPSVKSVPADMDTEEDDWGDVPESGTFASLAEDRDEEMLLPEEEAQKKKAGEIAAQRKLRTELLDKHFDNVKASITCPDTTCRLVGTMVRNGSNLRGPMITCNKCTKKVTGGVCEQLIRSLITEEVPESVQDRTTESATELDQLRASVQVLSNLVKTLLQEKKDADARIALLEKSLTTVRATQTSSQQKQTRMLEILEKMDPPTNNATRAIANNLREPAQAPPRGPAQATMPVNSGADTTNAAYGPTPQRDMKYTFAEAVRMKLPVNRLQEGDRARIESCIDMTKNFRPPPPPLVLVPLYFRVSRGPIGELRRALRTNGVPGTAMMNLCFIGGNTLEILCKREKTATLIYTMNKCKLPHLRNATPMNPFGTRDTPSEEKEQFNKNKLAIRMKILSARLGDGHAKRWVENTLAQAIKDGAAEPELTARQEGRRSPPTSPMNVTPTRDLISTPPTGSQDKEETPREGKETGDASSLEDVSVTDKDEESDSGDMSDIDGNLENKEETPQAIDPPHN